MNRTMDREQDEREVARAPEHIQIPAFPRSAPEQDAKRKGDAGKECCENNRAACSRDRASERWKYPQREHQQKKQLCYREESNNGWSVNRDFEQRWGKKEMMKCLLHYLFCLSLYVVMMQPSVTLRRWWSFAVTSCAPMGSVFPT